MTSETPRFEALSATFAFWLLRLWLGFRALLTGLEKFSGRATTQTPLLDEFGQPDMSGAMVSVESKVYGLSHYRGLPAALEAKFAAEPLIPGWALSLYSGVLGPLLILLGVTLLIGLAPRLTLFAMGLVYVSLSFGLILLNESGGIAWLGTHVLLVVAGLLLVRHDRFSVLPRW